MLRCSQTSMPPLGILHTQISEGRHIPFVWGVVHLVRHMDLFAGHPCALKALSQKCNCELAGQGGTALYQLSHQHSCNHYVDKIGWYLDSFQGKPGYSASWLLSKIMVPAASPSHPQWSMGGSPEGLMASSPATQGAATSSPNLACSSFPARSSPSHQPRSVGGNKGSMALLPATQGAATPSMSSAQHSTPAHPTTTASSTALSPPTKHTHNRRGGHCGRTPCCQDVFLLDSMHPAPLLVSPTASEASPSTLLWCIDVLHVNSG
jgi:hypothetical protein